MNKSIIYKAKEDKDIQEDLRKLRALQQEPCEDAISRQSVCNIVDAIRDCISVEGYWAILERLKKLPSVNPQKTFINKPCVSSGVCEHDKNKVLDKIRAEILEEKEYAYADFERYKVDYLGQDWEDALDSLPQDDFRYGMERAVEIINKYIAESER